MKSGKPAIYLLVILPILIVGGVLLPLRLLHYYAASKGIPLAAVQNIPGMLIALPAFFIWVPVGLLISNVVLAAIPPLRKIAVEYSLRAGRPGFLGSQLELFLVLLVICVVCVPLIVYGFAR